MQSLALAQKGKMGCMELIETVQFVLIHTVFQQILQHARDVLETGPHRRAQITVRGG